MGAAENTARSDSAPLTRAALTRAIGPSTMIKRWLITFAVAWLLGCVVTVLVAWCCVIGCNVRMVDWNGPEQLKWPMRPPSHWPAMPRSVSRFTAVAWPRGLEVATAGATRTSSELGDLQMLRVRAGWPLPALQSRVTTEYGLISIDDFTSGVRVAPHRTATRVYFAFKDTTLRLPTRILGWGFVANSTIAAILLLVPIALFRSGTRRTNRGRPGRTAACWIVAVAMLGTFTSVLVAGGLWLRWQTLVPSRPLLATHRDASGFLIGTTNISLTDPAVWPSLLEEEWAFRRSPAACHDLGLFPGLRATRYLDNEPRDSSGGRVWNFGKAYPRADVVCIGWPMRCMESVEFILRDGTRRPGRFCVEVFQFSPPVSPEDIGRMSPTRPYWLGLLANTLFYAYVIALPMLSIRAVRVVRRRRRGACESCGYSRAGLDASTPCPECGTAV